MMKKMWKNRSGVSPVIATILMVAITVVLAAVLYVMVMGFGGSSGGSAPAVKLSNEGSKVIINVNPASNFDQLKFSVDGGDPVVFDDAAKATSDVGTTPATATFADAGNDDKVTTGDYFTTTGSGTLNVYWVNGDTTQLITSIGF
jgi:flagellin-like protein